jgi:hypothetical protein
MSNFNLERDREDKTLSVNSKGGGSSIHISHMDEPEVEQTESGMFDFLINKNKKRADELSEKSETETEGSQYNNEEDTYEQDSFRQEEYEEKPRESEESIRTQKAFSLFMLKKLQQKGHVLSSEFTMDNPLDDIKNEITRIKREVEIEKSIRLSRQGLTFISSLMETGNNRFDPFGVDLEGWSESVNANIEDYDEVFEELYEKYQDKVSMSPEIKLLLMITGSAMSFHISKKMFGGGFETPDIMNTVSSAMGGGLGGGMGGGKMKGPSSGLEDVFKKMNLDNGDNVSISSSEASDTSSVRSKKGKRSLKLNL